MEAGVGPLSRNKTLDCVKHTRTAEAVYPVEGAADAAAPASAVGAGVVAGVEESGVVGVAPVAAGKPKAPGVNIPPDL